MTSVVDEDTYNRFERLKILTGLSRNSLIVIASQVLEAHLESAWPPTCGWVQEIGYRVLARSGGVPKKYRRSGHDSVAAHVKGCEECRAAMGVFSRLIHDAQEAPRRSRTPGDGESPQDA